LLRARAGRVSGEHRDVLRARIVLAAADGASNAAIGRALGVCGDTVRKWRRRFCQHGLDGLRDRPRTGRPRRFSATVVAEVKALACESPANRDVPLAKWSCPDLAVEAARRGVVDPVSASTVRRWLAADTLKPWQHRSWISPRDPHFVVKAARVLDLYARVFDGEPSGAATTCSVPTRNLACKPVAAFIPAGRPDRADGRCASKASTDATARWPTWPPMTCTALT
jgi:transposase